MTFQRRSVLEEAGLPPAPQAHVDSIPGAPASHPDSARRRGRKPKHTRKRDWEARHPPQTFTGLPPEIRQKIASIAAYFRQEQGMVGGVDAVARELLTYALSEYQAGQLTFDPQAVQLGTRLMSQPGTGIPPKKVSGHKKTTKASPKTSVTYRLPAELNAAIRAIPLLEQEKAMPRAIHLPLGYVVTRLLEHALTAYETGQLVLFTIPREAILGLTGEVSK